MEGVRIVGIAGGSGSGKTTIVSRITGFNFDHPDAFDSELLCEQLTALKAGTPVRMPQYDFVHHRRRNDTVLVEPRRLVIPEGGFNDRAMEALIPFLRQVAG